MYFLPLNVYRGNVRSEKRCEVEVFESCFLGFTDEEDEEDAVVVAVVVVAVVAVPVVVVAAASVTEDTDVNNICNAERGSLLADNP